MDFDSKDYAESLAKYLSSRFHPELPHIGTIGPADAEFLDNDYGDEEEEPNEPHPPQSGPSFGRDNFEYSSFRFVPFTASYVLNVQDQGKDLTTKFSFYLRIDEGSWHDLDGDLNSGFQKYDPENSRESEFRLTKEALARSFIKFDISICTDVSTNQQKVTVYVDDVEIKSFQELIQITETPIADGSKITLHLTYHSNPVITGYGENPHLMQQKYDVEFIKSIQKTGNGNTQIKVEIINKSPFNQKSVIPQIDIKNNGSYESIPECIARHKKEVFLMANQSVDIYDKWIPNLFTKKDAMWRANGSIYGHLLEFSATEYGIDSKNDPYLEESQVENVINLVFDQNLVKDNNGRFTGDITYRNYIIFDEKIPPMVFGDSLINSWNHIGMSEDFANIISKKYEKLYKFQYDAIKSINDSLKNNLDSGVLISARTGGGKTEAFLFPVIDYCLNSKHDGTKAIIFYPTNALANDQAGRIVELLYRVNEYLKSKGSEKKITVGMHHGRVPTSVNDLKWQQYWSGVPLKCPKCKKGTIGATDHVKAQCKNPDCLLELDFVILFQEPNFGLLPDILVTNPDKLQYDMMQNPNHHGIFGRKISSCSSCHKGYAQIGKRKCEECNGNSLEIKTPLPPKFIIFDEVHLFKGTFGTNVLYIHERLKKICKLYAKNNSQGDWSICTIGSSATMSNPDQFAKIFFGLNQKQIQIVPRDSHARDSYYDVAKVSVGWVRTHLFIMPYKYRPASSCSKAVGFLQSRRIDGIRPEPFSGKNVQTGDPLQILGFTNSITDIGQLINMIGREREYSIPVHVDGHSTDYDGEQRAIVERKFNLYETNVIFATPTLEVGVDFETVNVVVIYGFPYSFNDYIQRIGRGGRRENTLVVTVCHNYKPIDHFFYVDAKKRISQQHTSIEPIPITRDNSTIIKKQLVGALLDSISCMPNSPDIWKDIRMKMLDTLESNSVDMCDMTKEFSPINSLGLTDQEKNENVESLKRVIYEQIRRLKAYVQTIDRKNFLNDSADSGGIYPKYNVNQLRITEEEVNVETIWEVYQR